ncbi:MAG: PKD domain-containing protein [Bacteroidia bacterium]|nr:PKD domain-containing protein [Bacteroidia bacterium]
MPKNLSQILLLAAFLTLLTASCAKSPTACFSPSQTTSILKDTVHFTNCSLHAGSYNWEFGDGKVSLEENPVHVYAAPGTYEVKLWAFAAKGSEMETTTQTITVVPQNHRFAGTYTVTDTWCDWGDPANFTLTITPLGEDSLIIGNFAHRFDALKAWITPKADSLYLVREVGILDRDGHQWDIHRSSARRAGDTLYLYSWISDAFHSNQYTWWRCRETAVK